MAAVDCHVHVVDESTAIFEGSSAGYQRHVTTAEDILGLWQQYGIAAGALSQPSFLGLDNRCLESALAAYPGRFAGVVVLDWATVTEEDLLKRHALGVRGIRLNYFRGLPGGPPDLRSERARWLLGLLQGLGWHVEVYAPCRMLAEVLPPLAGVSVVVDHFGMPEPEDDASFEALLATGRSGASVTVMLSGDYRLAGDGAWVARQAARLLEAFGLGRLLWASDFPFTRYEDRGLTVAGQLEKLSTWVPDEEARRVILEETPRRVFGLEPPPPPT